MISVVQPRWRLVSVSEHGVLRPQEITGGVLNVTLYACPMRARTHATIVHLVGLNATVDLKPASKEREINVKMCPNI